MTRSLAVSFLTLTLTLTLAPRAAAQSGTPPPERTGTVTGQIVNGTSGGEVPAGLAVMLHAWDEVGEAVMLDGAADLDGAFRFEDVPMKDGWVFAAMLSYNDVTFFSENGEVASQTKEIALPLTIYETTSDASTVRIAQMHAFLDFAPGELTVGEIYVLSNPGDRAVAGGLALPDNRTATLQFMLPAGVNEVGFQGDNSGQRFVITPEGFADTGAVLPGEGTAQVIVTYSLPYSSGMTFAHTVNYPVEAVNVLMSADSGVTLAGKGLSDPTPRQMQTGETFNVYAAGPLASGESITVTLTGQPIYHAGDEASGAMTQPQPSALAAVAERWGFPIAGGILGVAMIVFGAWWWRRGARIDVASEPEFDPAADWETVLRGIAELDEAHERGEVIEEAYRTRRAELRMKAKAILQAKEAGE